MNPRRVPLLAILPALLPGAGLLAAPMAGSLRVLEGKVSVASLGRTARDVLDFARIELGDRLQVAEGTRANLALFDSGAVSLLPGSEYAITRTGVSRRVASGAFREYQFAVPLDAGTRAPSATRHLGVAAKLSSDAPGEVVRSGARGPSRVGRSDALWFHDWLRTGESARTVLELDTRAAVAVGPGTRVQLQRDALVLEAGEVLVDWRREGQRFEILTPRAEFAMRSAVVRIRAVPGGAEEIEVFSGRVDARYGQDTRVLREGESLATSADGLRREPGRTQPPADARRLAADLRKRLRGASQTKDVGEAVGTLLDLAKGQYGPAPGPESPSAPDHRDEDPPALALPLPTTPTSGRPEAAPIASGVPVAPPPPSPPVAAASRPTRRGGWKNDRWDPVPASVPGLSLPAPPLTVPAELAAVATRAAGSAAASGAAALGTSVAAATGAPGPASGSLPPPPPAAARTPAPGPDGPLPPMPPPSARTAPVASPAPSVASTGIPESPPAAATRAPARSASTRGRDRDLDFGDDPLGGPMAGGGADYSSMFQL